MKKAIQIYNQIEEKFCTLTFLVVIVLILVQVFGRYVVGNAPTWSEEMSRYLYVYECWLGVSLTERERRHIQLTFLLDMFPKNGRRVADVVAWIITVATALILTYYGIQLVLFAFERGNVSPALHLPMWIYYLCLPLGCIAYLFRKVPQIIHILKGETEASLTDADIELENLKMTEGGEA